MFLQRYDPEFQNNVWAYLQWISYWQRKSLAVCLWEQASLYPRGHSCYNCDNKFVQESAFQGSNEGYHVSVLQSWWSHLWFWLPSVFVLPSIMWVNLLRWSSVCFLTICAQPRPCISHSRGGMVRSMCWYKRWCSLKESHHTIYPPSCFKNLEAGPVLKYISF